MFARQYLPALISAVVLSLGDVVDSLVLGNRLGYIGLAALALTMPVAQIFNIIMNAMGIGGSVRFSSKMAQGKREEAVRGFQGVFCTALISGIAIGLLGNIFLTPLLGLLGTTSEDGELFRAAAGYLRILLFGTPMLFLNYVLNYYLKTDDLEKEAGAAFTAGNIVDIALNVILVLCFRMGVVGASLATVIGQTFGAVSALIIMARHKGVLTLRGMKPDLKDAWQSFRMGFSSSVEFLYNMMFLLLANHLLMRFMGSVGVAILDVILGVSYFMMNLYDAVAKSALPVISTYCGERNEAGMTHARNYGLVYSLISGLVLGGIVWLFPDIICRFFGMDDPDMLELGRSALRLYGMSIPVAGIGILMTNYYEARQQEKETMVRSTVRGILPILLAGIFLIFAPERFWTLYLISETVAVLIFAVIHIMYPPERYDMDRIYRGTFYSSGDEITRTNDEIEEFCDKWNAEPKQRHLTMMSVEELCVATMDNGFQGKPDGFIQIVLIALEDGGFELHIRDNAASFNPLAMELEEGLSDDEASFNALGVMTIKKLAKSFSYRHFQGFNTVIILI